MKTYIRTWLAIILCISSSFTFSQHVNPYKGIKHLKFLSEYDVPYNKKFDNTTIGGLSGIDYDSKRKIYYMISDDRSDKNPARFYEASIFIHKYKIDSVVFLQTKPFTNKEHKTYPNAQQDPYHTPDPEAMRYNPANNTFIWSSEGERIVRPGKIILEDPTVTLTDTDGNYMDTFELPAQMHMQPVESGPRQNGVFEGLTFANDYKTLFVNVEEPLYNDGSRAGLDDSSGTIRIIKYDIKSRKPIAQYAYVIDPVPFTPVPANAYRINGIPDILSVGPNKLLVIERAFSSGRPGCTIKVFLADLSFAENINSVMSLKDNSTVATVSKKLLLNMNNLGFYIDNIEGVTFGPSLPNGHRTLLFIADNNFQFIEKTQILLFEVD